MPVTLNNKQCIIVSYNSIPADPPPRQAALSLSEAGYKVTIVQPSGLETYGWTVPPSISLVEIPVSSQRYRNLSRPVRQLVRWLRFRRGLSRILSSSEPDII